MLVVAPGIVVVVPGIVVVVASVVVVEASVVVVVTISVVVVPLSLNPVVEVLSWPGMVVPGVQFSDSRSQPELPPSALAVRIPAPNTKPVASAKPAIFLPRGLTVVVSCGVEALSLMIILSLN